jgi:hypothetical protein
MMNLKASNILVAPELYMEAEARTIRVQLPELSKVFEANTKSNPARSIEAMVLLFLFGVSLGFAGISALGCFL